MSSEGLSANAPGQHASSTPSAKMSGAIIVRSFVGQAFGLLCPRAISMPVRSPHVARHVIAINALCGLRTKTFGAAQPRPPGLGSRLVPRLWRFGLSLILIGNPGLPAWAHVWCRASGASDYLPLITVTTRASDHGDFH